MEKRFQEFERRLSAAERRARASWVTLFAIVLVAGLFATARPALTQGGGGQGGLMARVETLERKVAALETTVAGHTNQIAALRADLDKEIQDRKDEDVRVLREANEYTDAAFRRCKEYIDQQIAALRRYVDGELARIWGAGPRTEGALGELRHIFLDPSSLPGNTLPLVRRSVDDIVIEGGNLNVRSGQGNTWIPDGTPNGKGNLIIGYNEPRNDGSDDRIGSHYLVVGTRHNYRGFAGIIAGDFHEIGLRVPFASITGGFQNQAVDVYTSVTGGYLNRATGCFSSVSGGFSNEAFGDRATVSGGVGNQARGPFSSISGGENHVAHGVVSWIAGGFGNVALEQRTSAVGGINNHARAAFASVMGGQSNMSDGIASSISGGFNAQINGHRQWAAGSPGGLTIPANMFRAP